MNYFRLLRDSGLPIDWTTIQEGRIGFGDFYSGLLTLDQLIEYAKGRLGEGTPDHQYLVFQIIDAGSRDLWTVERCLAELAWAEKTTVSIARRRWRLAAVMAFVQSPGPYLEDESEDFKYCLEWLWDRFDLPEGPPDLPCKNAFQSELDIDRSIQLLKDWIREETARVQ